MPVRKIAVVAVCFMLAACSHSARKSVVGVVEYDTGITRFSTVTGIYHQDMCSKQNPDAQVHLSNSEMGKILKQANKTGFYRVKADLRTDWPDPADKPAHCGTYRLHIEAGALHNDVRWNCARDGSNAPPAEVAPMVELIKKTLRSKPEVRGMAWSSCGVR